MFTYMPYGNGMYYNAFGYPFYSPTNVSYFTPSTGFSGSAYPIGKGATSPHYNSSNGTYNMGPRPSTGGTSSPGTASAASAFNGFSGSGSSTGSSGSGLSSGSSGSAGHSSGGGATSGRGK
jgi:hypothetical protein